MLFRLWVFLFYVSAGGTLEAGTFTLDALSDGSHTYSNVTVIGANATDLYFTHSKGISNVKLKYLPPNLQARFNYDPQAAAEAEKEQIRDNSRYYQAIESNLVTLAVNAATVARKAASSSDESFADPISEQSHLGKPAPALKVEKWLGPEPLLKGKAVLICFWAPWSVPSRRYLPFLNALEKKYSDRLVLVGITADSEQEIAAMAEPHPEFPCAIDSKARLAADLGIASIPAVAMIDAKGIIRYVGHPAALDERILQVLLPKPGE